MAVSDHLSLTKRSVWIPLCFFGGTLLIYIYYNDEITKDKIYTSVFSSHKETKFSTMYPLNPDITMDMVENYFHKAIELSQGKLLIDTEKCKIPDIDPWSLEVRHMFHNNVAPRCVGNINLTYVDKTDVIIDNIALANLNQVYRNISCCYRSIERVDQTLEHYDGNADNTYEYSEICYPMTAVTEPISGSILVNCTGINVTEADVIVYQNVHALAKLSQKQEEKLLPKFLHWKECATLPDCKRPPSVLMLGIDSTSRLNFHRNMNKTIQFLREIDAVEMKGYTKVGDNTYPNFIPLMSPYTEDEAIKNCIPENSKPQDYCPYVWKNFSSQNYITGHFEDSPKMAIFNYIKTGFVNAPADFYSRPWMLAAYTEHSEDKHAHFSIDCLGYQRPEEILIKYNFDLISLLESKSAPYFITNWLTDLAHDDMNNIQTMDTLLANTLTKLFRNGFLDNTILIVMSDHGYRWGSLRATTSGWFELKLPAMFVRISEHLRQRFPFWNDALQYNAKLLTTPFDVQETLKDILRISNPNIENSTSLRGQSLLGKISSRSCDEAAIPTEYCACYMETANNIDISIVQLGAEEIVRKINQDLPQNCSELIPKKVTAALVAKESHNKTFIITDYSISFETEPGDFSFEAIATYDNIANYFKSVSNIQRTNKKTEDTDCLGESESRFELFCHCKD